MSSMVSAGIIAIMFIVLIYFVVRGQGLQRDVKLANNATKNQARRLKSAQQQVAFMAHELQRIFLSRLESLNKRGLLSQDDYQIAYFILNRFEFVLMNCTEHGSTVEEAVNRALMHQSVTIEQVNEFIKKQPSEVRVAWCQNTQDGFIAACRGISTGSLNSKAADSEAAAVAEG
ncbi:hypothetical protein QTP81_01555 [Alteromonas sp. ASW11-36]|uniref:DUF2489 domain-containing protein n=1 Tax=Alteromonas arenosi TaxID=3055817 RepID=A0ABT7SUS1_9ALTE|nr:hypothetical protein [Alteromonas sp. ASW11-36]MDM7859289.1 hypothetical protein [Alteromonas sp. ASW11-36]